MAKKAKGSQSVTLQHPPIIVGAASVVGKKEGDGPYGSYFDQIEEDEMISADSWEEAEQQFQEKAAKLAIEKSGLSAKDIRYIVAGDLLGQLIASSFGLMNLDIPIFGVYGACSTMGESIAIGSMLVDGGYADRVMSLTSSHFASAEKQFRFPLAYGSQRPKAATWTVTGSGAVVLCSQELITNPSSELVQVSEITTGKIMDYGVKDSMNMGACMAPAAANVISANLQDFNRQPSDYDQIITGDLGKVGKDILIDILRAKGYDISANYMDCGIEIYEENQNVQAGGSGCGCSAVMLTGYLLKKLQKQEWKKILFVPTGALLSTVSFNEGNSVPGVAHGIVLECIKGGK